MIAALHVRSLALSRGDRLLFEGFSLDMGRGEAVVLTGRNGAGKTSLLRAVAGLIRPQAGDIVFQGADAPLASEDARSRDLHLLGHQDGLKAGRTAWEELLFHVQWTGGSRDSAEAACARLDLERLRDLEVRKLSAGQRRRLALARLIASPRRLWLLDEPLSPLDAERRGIFGDMMAAHLADGGLILAAVHDPLPIPARTVEICGMSGFSVLMRRELALSWSRGGGPLLALAFYLALAALIPLAAGSEPARLAAVAPGVAWLALALATLLSLERLFERDFEDGALDLLALGPAPLEVAAFVKCFAQWLTTGAPLALLAPVVAVALGAPLRAAPLTLAAGLIGGWGFAFCGGIGAALSLGSRRGGVLIAVIVLPLFAPPVILGAGSIDAFVGGLDWKTGLLLLAAYSLSVSALGPFAMAAACRNALS